MMIGEKSLHFSVCLTLFLLFLSSCGPPRGPLEAPKGMPKGPIPLWSAVTRDSTIVIHGNPGPFFDIPLARMGIGLLQKEFEESSIMTYADMVQEFGFDPIYDLNEFFVTNLEGGLDESFVLLLRYKQETDLIEPIIKVFSGMMKEMKSTELRRLEIEGRKAVLFEFEEDRVVGIQVDPFTVALLHGSQEDAVNWLGQMSTPNENRKRIAGRLERLAAHKGLRGRKPSLGLFIDFLAVDSFMDIGNTISVNDMKKVAAQIAVERAIFIVAEVDYKDEASARHAEEELGRLFTDPPPSIAFFNEMLRQIRDSLKVERKDTLLKGEVTIPESVLDTVYMTLKMLLDLGKGMEGFSFGQ